MDSNIPTNKKDYNIKQNRTWAILNFIFETLSEERLCLAADKEEDFNQLYGEALKLYAEKNT